MTTKQLLFNAMIDAHGNRNPIRRANILKNIPCHLTFRQFDGALQRMVKDGLVSKISRGVYRLNTDAQCPTGQQVNLSAVSPAPGPARPVAKHPTYISPDPQLNQYLYGPVGADVWK